MRKTAGSNWFSNNGGLAAVPFAYDRSVGKAKVKLGSQGAVVSRMGLRCMGMSEFYGARNEA